MLIARKGHCNGHGVPALIRLVQHASEPLNGSEFPPQALTNNHNVVQSFSPGLAAAAYPGCAVQNDSTLKELNHSPLLVLAPATIAGQSLSLPTHPHPKSTLAHPKSTVDLGCELLIKVENSLISPLPPTSYRPISAPKIRGFSQNQTVTDRKKLKQTSPGRLISRITGHTTGRDLPRGCIAKADGRDAVTNLCSVPSVTLWLFPLKLKILIHPYLPVQPVNASPTKSNLIKNFSEKKHMRHLQNLIHAPKDGRHAVASIKKLRVLRDSVVNSTIIE
jgi:hypothetical protein